MIVTKDEIHIWRLRTDQPHQVVGRLEKWLSPDERDRAEKFASPALRSRFIIHRGSLRVLLGQYLRARPDRISFEYGAHGKPRVSGVFGGLALQFNLSHSEDLAVVAIGLGRSVGIDIERMRTVEDAMGIVERFFGPNERRAYLRATDAERTVLFLQAWTRKEAYLKATGEGISFPLERVEVSLGDKVSPRLTRVDGRPDDPLKWSMIDLETSSDFIGALVAEGSGWQTKQFVFDPSAS